MHVLGKDCKKTTLKLMDLAEDATTFVKSRIGIFINGTNYS